jgi:hypothetical protein
MQTEIIKMLVFLKHITIYKKWDFLAKINQFKFLTNPSADFVVSIASYPKRSHLLPAVFEALNQQTVVPKKWLLVLSEEEWPDLQLPPFLNKLVQRGLEIVWVKNNTYAVKKLVPVIEKYPDFAIITFDDELIYHKRVIEKLITSSKVNVGCVIGHVAKKLHQNNGVLKMLYREQGDANMNTPNHQVYFLGGSGTYYPANSLDNRVTDIDAITKIVPGRGSDIWFWAAAVAKSTKQICLGSKTDSSLYFAVPTTKDTNPKDTPGKDTMENRFQMAIDFFEIREKLLANLPNK